MQLTCEMSNQTKVRTAQLTPRSWPSSTYFTTASPPPNRSEFCGVTKSLGWNDRNVGEDMCLQETTEQLTLSLHPAPQLNRLGAGQPPSARRRSSHLSFISSIAAAGFVEQHIHSTQRLTGPIEGFNK